MESPRPQSLDGFAFSQRKLNLRAQARFDDPRPYQTRMGKTSKQIKHHHKHVHMRFGIKFLI
ncbi:hypothetical protein Hanom_Chr00s000125g01623391 [Helianthus anomalus]